MKKLNFWILFSLILLTTLSTSKSFAQDDDTASDSPTIVPSTTSTQGNRPTIMDESDSDEVSDVDEYEN